MKFSCLLLAFVVLIAVFDTTESRSMVNEKPETDIIFEFIDHQEENIEYQKLNVLNQDLNLEHQRENILQQEISLENLQLKLENHMDLENLAKHHNMAYEVDTDDQERYGTYARPRLDHKKNSKKIWL